MVPVPVPVPVPVDRWTGGTGTTGTGSGTGAGTGPVVPGPVRSVTQTKKDHRRKWLAVYSLLVVIIH